MQLRKKTMYNRAILALILLVAAILRFKALDFQSLWLDELHTMLECDPTKPWSNLFNALRSSDQHPPLFFVLERLFFSVFGHTAVVARSLSAIAGIACVWAMYKLGKVILNERLGLIAAAITCVNSFHLFYSQEARDYMFLWLFATLSYTYFIQLYNDLKRSTAILYIITTALMLYSHYFSLLVVMCQLVLVVTLWLLEKDKAYKKRMLITFLISNVVVLALYIPWMPYLLKMGEIKSFWIQLPWEDFYYNFFNEYFGYAAFLNPFLYICIIIYMVSVAKEEIKSFELRTNPLVFSFLFVFITITVSYLIPYIRSVVEVPMLIARYTVIVVPSIFIMVAFGLELMKNNIIRTSILAIFIFLSLLDIFTVRKYYTTVRKEQFREVGKYVSYYNNNYPIINAFTGWHMQYYMKEYRVKTKELYLKEVK